MKKTILTLGLAVSAILFQSINMNAQELPALSPGSQVKQTAGLTDVTLTYSSPAVRGRTIFGGLLDYDKMWRTGANAPTRIKFSEDVTIGGKKLKANEYAIITIPGKEEWTIIISENRNARVSSYKEEEDAVRIKVKPQTIPSSERLTFWFSDYDNKHIVVNFAWADVYWTFEVQLHTDEQATENIDRATGWRPTMMSGRYYYEEGQYEKALGLINQSLALNERWYTLWYKALTLHDMGNHKEAYAAVTRTKELGDADEAKGNNFFFEDRVNEAVESWKKR